jgi:hypothetical protein
VRLRLIPREERFFDLFVEDAANVVGGARLLEGMLRSWDEIERRAGEIRDVEHRGDEISHTIGHKLESTFVTPFDREDIYALANGLDDVMDDMEEAADLINLYEIGDLPHELAKQVETIQRCAEVTAAAMPRLQSLDLEEFWLEIGRLEKAGDKSYRRIIAKLFSGNYEAMEVLKLKDVAQILEGAINAFERVAKTVEQIAVKES